MSALMEVEATAPRQKCLYAEGWTHSRSFDRGYVYGASSDTTFFGYSAFLGDRASKDFSSTPISKFCRLDHGTLKIFPLSDLFQALLANWREERGATSSITEMAMCSSYLRIIGLGPDVIRLIFRQMEREGDEPDMWFVALQMLTGADPVTEEARGNFKAMADLWLDWGRANGYAW